jgi:hypothetical protein
LHYELRIGITPFPGIDHIGKGIASFYPALFSGGIAGDNLALPVDSMRTKGITYFPYLLTSTDELLYKAGLSRIWLGGTS